MDERFTLQFASENEINDWDNHVLFNKYDAGFLQSKAYADTKAAFGWKIQYVVYKNRREKIYGYFLSKKVPLLGLLWYMPSGSLPLKYMHSILQANKSFTKKHKLPIFLIKIEPMILDTIHARRTLAQLGLTRAMPIQAHNSTILLDLTAPLPDSLSSKARRDIRLASKQSIDVRRLPFSDLASRTMYELMKTVNRGKGSAFIRPYSYYQTFWRNFSKNGKGDFYFAYENDRAIVGAFVVNFGSTRIYKDGGSTPDTLYKKRYSMAVQWQAIQDAKAEGGTLYDLCGVPPKEELYSPEHPYYGIGQFKLKFKKETVDYCGAYEQVLRPFSYSNWMRLKQIIYKLHLLKYNDLYF